MTFIHQSNTLLTEDLSMWEMNCLLSEWKDNYAAWRTLQALFIFVVLVIWHSGGEGLNKSLHIPRVYFKRFLPVSNLVSLCGNKFKFQYLIILSPFRAFQGQWNKQFKWRMTIPAGRRRTTWLFYNWWWWWWWWWWRWRWRWRWWIINNLYYLMSTFMYTDHL